MLHPLHLVEDIQRRVLSGRDKGSILAFWLQVHGSRREYADQVRNIGTDSGIIPLVVSNGFLNVNELMADLSRLISNNEPAFVGIRAPATNKPTVLLLLSHSEFQLPQIASPAVLPEWFPGIGGCEVSIWIEDLTWTAEVPVNSPASRIDELCECICELDRTMIDRQLSTLKTDHRLGSGWYAEVRKCAKKSDDFSQHLAAAHNVLQKVADRRAYRLDIKNGLTPLACAVLLASKTAPDALGTLGQLLTRWAQFQNAATQL